MATERGFRAFSRRAGRGKIDHTRGTRKRMLKKVGEKNIYEKR